MFSASLSLRSSPPPWWSIIDDQERQKITGIEIDAGERSRDGAVRQSE
jgi:hypothetical protein